MSFPKTFKALVSNGDKTASVKEITLNEDIPHDHILVRVRTVGLNPTDWKTLEHGPPKDNILGCDSAGDVVKVGSEVTRIKVGDRVAGFTYGASSKISGAFSEYVRLRAEFVFLLPKTCSYNEGASFPIPHATTVQGLYAHLNLPMPSKATRTDDIILVWGGSTAVGHHLVQLARLTGLRVFVTASPDTHAYMKQLGAEECFDYHDKDVAEQIKAAAGAAGVKYGFDTVAEGGTGIKAADAMGPQGGKVVSLFPQKDAEKFRKDVEIDFILLYTVYADHLQYDMKYQPHDSKVVGDYMQHEFTKIMEGWVEGKGSENLKPQKLRVEKGGLEKVAEGLETMRKGQYGREKLVYPIA